MENFGDGTDILELLVFNIILSHLLLPDEFPVANPIKHGRNYFVRRLHYAAGESGATHSISPCIAGYGPTPLRLCAVSNGTVQRH